MKFIVDARTILHLGRDSIKDHTTAVIELVKNSYDANAAHVEVEVMGKGTAAYIRIADNGVGMSEKEIQDSWLRIGFSRKIGDRFIGERRRRKTGEKGIGRISADRLGAQLILKTRTDRTHTAGLHVDWDQFDVDGKQVEDVDIPALAGVSPVVPGGTSARNGTELIIEELRQPWSARDVEALHDELSLLLPPFKSSDFNISLRSDIWTKGKVEVLSLAPLHSEIDFVGRFDGEMLHYDISESGKKINTKKLNNEISWNQILQSVGESSEKSAKSLGPIELRIMSFVRPSGGIDEQSLSPGKIREFLNKFSGIRIYRDNIRVKPYGDPENPQGDWLGLADRRQRDPAGVSRATFKFGSNQLVGAIYIGRDQNPSLIDSSAREGLVDNDSYVQLANLSLGCVRLMETHRHVAKIAQKNSSPAAEVARGAVGAVSKEITALRNELNFISGKLPSPLTRSLESVFDRAEAVSKSAALTGRSIEELIRQNGLYRGLATIGIAAAAFGHETQSSIDQFKSSVTAADALLRMKSPRIADALSELETAEIYSNKVAAWGAFALARIQHEKRKKRTRELPSLISELIQHVKPIFDSADIVITENLKDCRAHIFEMDVEAVMLNLLTNAYHACQQVRRDRKIHVKLVPRKQDGRDGFLIEVTDSGPGVAIVNMNKIWEPLFTTKTDGKGKEIGTGLGLTIVKSIVDDVKGRYAVGRDLELQGACFGIWMPTK